MSNPTYTVTASSSITINTSTFPGISGSGNFRVRILSKAAGGGGGGGYGFATGGGIGIGFSGGGGGAGFTTDDELILPYGDVINVTLGAGGAGGVGGAFVFNNAGSGADGGDNVIVTSVSTITTPGGKGGSGGNGASSGGNGDPAGEQGDATTLGTGGVGGGALGGAGGTGGGGGLSGFPPVYFPGPAVVPVMNGGRGIQTNTGAGGGGGGGGTGSYGQNAGAGDIGYVQIEILPRLTPVIVTWPTAANTITAGQQLQEAGLIGGVASISGEFTYVSPTLIPPVGTAAYAVVFTPTNQDIYESVTDSVNVTVLAPPTPTSTATGRIITNMYGADHESIRVSKRIEACKCLGGPAYEPPSASYFDPCPRCLTAQKEPQVTVVSEHNRILPGVTRCLLYQRNIHTGALCQGTKETIHASPPAGLLGATPPHRLHGYRKYDRVRGIEELARYVRGPSSSEVTSRLRRVIEHAAATATRHSEHFRVRPPPPPCRLVRTGPQPGVPIAPVTPCNPGTQRVDYSIPQK